MWRIKVYKDRILMAISLVGALASILSLGKPLLIESTQWAWGLPITVLCLMVLLTGVAFKSDVPTKVYKVDNRQGIRNYMFQWIKNGQRVVIWTRDLSWVDDDEMKRMLRDKAQSDDLIICLPRDTEAVDYLKEEGAQIVAYGGLDVPALTFTIVNYGHVGSRVAVGWRRVNHRIIQEFAASDEDPSFHMAQDLVKLAMERSNGGER